MKLTPPRYLINPMASQAVLWAPEPYQTIVGHTNPSYLNSVWLGSVYNLLTMPVRFFGMVMLPLFNFQFIRLLVGLFAFFLSVVGLFVYGVFGRLRGIPVEPEVTRDSMLLPKEQCREAIDRGHRLLVIDLSQDYPGAPHTAASLDK